MKTVSKLRRTLRRQQLRWRRQRDRISIREVEDELQELIDVNLMTYEKKHNQGKYLMARKNESALTWQGLPFEINWKLRRTLRRQQRRRRRQRDRVAIGEVEDELQELIDVNLMTCEKKHKKCQQMGIHFLSTKEESALT